MRRYRFVLAAVLTSLAVTACDGGTEPPTPSFLVVSSGDNQTGPAGLPLPVPLQVALTGSDGRPFRGAPVAWQVTAGGGSVEAASTTDVDGVATAIFTLGQVAGVNVVSAVVTGVAPASFSATGVVGPPGQIEVLTGDQQSAARATPLAEPIVVRVLDQFGNPASNVVLTFAGPEGSFDPGSAMSDAQGQAQAEWTLGTTIGPQTGTVAAGALASATLSATALDPCETAAARPIALGSTVAGSLAATDCVLDNGTFLDGYALRTTSFESVRIDLTSSAVDAYLRLYDGLVNIVAADDDHGGTLNSAIRVLVRPDSYFVGASSFWAAETGPYALSPTPVSPAIDDCDHDLHVWVTRGIETTQEVRVGDCVTVSGSLYDHVLLVLYPGETVTVAMNSTALDAALQLWDLSASPDSLVASDDNSGGGTNALFSHTAPSTDSFVRSYAIWATSGVMGQTGPYTLSIAPPAVAAAVRAEGSVGSARVRNGFRRAPLLTPARKASVGRGSEVDHKP